MEKNIFGDEFYKDGVLAKAGDFTIYTSHEEYDKIIKEMDNQSAMDSQSNRKQSIYINC